MRLVDTIPGMCGEAKMVAVIEAMRHAPGGRCGRDRFLVGPVGRAVGAGSRAHYGIGNVLCVDPWRADAMVQGDADAGRGQRRTSTPRRRCACSRSISRRWPRAAQLSAPDSETPRPPYGPGFTVNDRGLRRDRATRAHISVLHIDGNHAEAEVASGLRAVDAARGARRLDHLRRLRMGVRRWRRATWPTPSVAANAERIGGVPSRPDRRCSCN